VLDLLLVMACVAAGFFLVIRMGFVLHAEPLPAPFDSTLLTAISVGVLVAGFAAATVAAVRCGGWALTAAQIRRDANHLDAAYREARRLRVAELAADPARAWYAPLVERGEVWTEENIAYYEDRESVMTCIHLQPVERAMRRTGIDLRRRGKAEVQANCRIDAVALQQGFALVPPARYAEFFQAERHEHDNPTAYLICDRHLSMIRVVHPEETKSEDAPVFPETTPIPPAQASSI
jgi:hypothetical protein